MKFRTAAKNFRLIDDEDQVSLIVAYASASPTAREVAPLIARLRAGDSDRGLLRGLQRFIVQVRQRAADTWQQRRDIEEVLPGLFILNNALLYDHGLGLLRDGRPLSAKSLVQ